MGLPDWLPGRPGGDPQHLRDMARAWDALDTALADSERRLRPHADYVYNWWRGSAAEAFASAWVQYSAALPSMHTSITTMSGRLRDAAQKIQDAQDRYDQNAEIAMGIGAAGLVLTVFTLGVSDLAAAGGESGIIAGCTALIETLAAAMSAIGDVIAGCYASLSLAASSLTLTLATSEVAIPAGMAAVAMGTTYLSGDHDPRDIGLIGLFTFFSEGGSIRGSNPDEGGDVPAPAGSGGGTGKGNNPDEPAGGKGTSGRSAGSGGAIPRSYSSTDDSLNHVATRHGDVFGYPRQTPDNATRASFDSFIRSWINDPSHQQVVGAYRGEPAIFYFEAVTDRVIFTYPDGSLWSGWRLTAEQVRYLFTTGNVL